MRCERCPLANVVKPKSNTVLCLAFQEEHDYQPDGACEVGERIEAYTRAMCATAKEHLFDKTLSIIEKMIK